MSFQDVSSPSVRLNRYSAEGVTPGRSRRGPPHRIVVQSAPNDHDLRKPRNIRRIALHGKVEEIECSDTEMDLIQRERELHQRNQRQSDFQKLAHETQQYQKLVSDFCSLMDSAGETPEAAWRARIVMRSAQDADKDLWEKLYRYEKTLVAQETNKEEMRMAQTACMKLHRDFKRSQKALIMALSTFEMRQAAEVSRLGALGWSGGEEANEDILEKALRERDEELAKMNQSMHLMNEIYKDLMNVVDSQQERIDILEDNIAYAARDVESASTEIGCFTLRDHFCGAFNFDAGNDDGISCHESESGMADEEKSAESVWTSKRSISSIARRHIREEIDFYTPFETLPEDLLSVKKDVEGLGKEMIFSIRRFEC